MQYKLLGMVLHRTSIFSHHFSWHLLSEKKLGKSRKNRQDDAKIAFPFDKSGLSMYNINKNRPYRAQCICPYAEVLTGIQQGGLTQKWLITQILMFW